MSIPQSQSGDFQSLSIVLVWWGGLLLVIIGLLKMVLYAVGAMNPGLFDRLGSVTLRKFLTGRGHRLVFGWGGFITAAVGGFFMLAARLMAMLMERFGS